MNEARTVAAGLGEAKAIGIDRLDAQLLLAHVLARPRPWLSAYPEAAMDETHHDTFIALLKRRGAGEPLAYLVGEKAFHGLVLQVDANVLVPRPDTELLVDWALERLAPDACRQVVDLGTGSGAIALAVKRARPAVSMLATDISTAALEVTRANAARLGLEVATLRADWWHGLEGRRFDLVLANPPYIAAGDPHLSALRHEPALALTPGGDGLDALREIVADAARHLVPGGSILLEHGYDQADAVQALLGAAGFVGIETRRDLGGQPRCTGGSR